MFAATVGAQPALRGDVGQVADRGGPPVIPDRVAHPDPSHPAPVDGTAPPVPSAPLKVLVVGDSQAATLAQGVHADPGVYGLSARPGLAVWNRAILGCPIIRAPWFMIDGERQQNRCGGTGLWERQWTSDVATFQPDAVVVLAGAWDVFDVADPDGTVERPGDAAWTVAYERDLGALIDTLSITGAPVIAVKPPCWGESELAGTDPERPERLDVSRVAAVDTAWRVVVKSHRARLLDLDRVLCPDGQSDAGIRPDGAHFDGPGGSRRPSRCGRDPHGGGCGVAGELRSGRRGSAAPAEPVAHDRVGVGVERRLFRVHDDQPRAGAGRDLGERGRGVHAE